jgi:hypothetical protein
LLIPNLPMALAQNSQTHSRPNTASEATAERANATSLDHMIATLQGQWDYRKYPGFFAHGNNMWRNTHVASPMGARVRDITFDVQTQPGPATNSMFSPRGLNEWAGVLAKGAYSFDLHPAVTTIPQKMLDWHLDRTISRSVDVTQLSPFREGVQKKDPQATAILTYLHGVDLALKVIARTAPDEVSQNGLGLGASNKSPPGYNMLGLNSESILRSLKLDPVEILNEALRVSAPKPLSPGSDPQKIQEQDHKIATVYNRQYTHAFASGDQAKFLLPPHLNYQLKTLNDELLQNSKLSPEKNERYRELRAIADRMLAERVAEVILGKLQSHANNLVQEEARADPRTADGHSKKDHPGDTQQPDPGAENSSPTPKAEEITDADRERFSAMLGDHLRQQDESLLNNCFLATYSNVVGMLESKYKPKLDEYYALSEEDRNAYSELKPAEQAKDEFYQIASECFDLLKNELSSDLYKQDISKEARLGVMTTLLQPIFLKKISQERMFPMGHASAEELAKRRFDNHLSKEIVGLNEVLMDKSFEEVLPENFHTFLDPEDPSFIATLRQKSKELEEKYGITVDLSECKEFLESKSIGTAFDDSDASTRRDLLNCPAVRFDNPLFLKNSEAFLNDPDALALTYILVVNPPNPGDSERLEFQNLIAVLEAHRRNEFLKQVSMGKAKVNEYSSHPFYQSLSSDAPDSLIEQTITKVCEYAPLVCVTGDVTESDQMARDLIRVEFSEAVLRASHVMQFQGSEGRLRVDPTKLHYPPLAEGTGAAEAREQVSSFAGPVIVGGTVFSMSTGVHGRDNLDHEFVRSTSEVQLHRSSEVLISNLQEALETYQEKLEAAMKEDGFFGPRFKQLIWGMAGLAATAMVPSPMTWKIVKDSQEWMSPAELELYNAAQRVRDADNALSRHMHQHGLNRSMGESYKIAYRDEPDSNSKGDEVVINKVPYIPACEGQLSEPMKSPHYMSGAFNPQDPSSYSGGVRINAYRHMAACTQFFARNFDVNAMKGYSDFYIRSTIAAASNLGAVATFPVGGVALNFASKGASAFTRNMATGVMGKAAINVGRRGVFNRVALNALGDTASTRLALGAVRGANVTYRYARRYLIPSIRGWKAGHSGGAAYRASSTTAGSTAGASGTTARVVSGSTVPQQASLGARWLKASSPMLMITGLMKTMGLAQVGMNHAMGRGDPETSFWKDEFSQLMYYGQEFTVMDDDGELVAGPMAEMMGIMLAMDQGALVLKRALRTWGQQTLAASGQGASALAQMPKGVRPTVVDVARGKATGSEWYASAREWASWMKHSPRGAVAATQRGSTMLGNYGADLTISSLYFYPESVNQRMVMDFVLDHQIKVATEQLQAAKEQNNQAQINELTGMIAQFEKQKTKTVDYLFEFATDLTMAYWFRNAEPGKIFEPSDRIPQHQVLLDGLHQYQKDAETAVNQVLAGAPKAVNTMGNEVYQLNKEQLIALNRAYKEAQNRNTSTLQSVNRVVLDVVSPKDNAGSFKWIPYSVKKNADGTYDVSTRHSGWVRWFSPEAEAEMLNQYRRSRTGK